MKKVPLVNGITYDGKQLKEITLRKPGAGELRGLKLIDVLQMDIDTMFSLIPRIATPVLTEQDVEALDPMDLTSVVSETVGFFTGSEAPSQTK